jgi:hypothetical protein
MRILGVPIESPQTVINRIASDVSAIARLARTVPAQFDRLLELGEEIAATGRELLAYAERLDQRAEAVLELGGELDQRGGELIELGTGMQVLGERIDARGAEIVDGAARVADTGNDLIAVLPALERALEMATPLEGAIDRFGRFVDRLPGGGPRPRPGPGAAPADDDADG